MDMCWCWSTVMLYLEINIHYKLFQILCDCQLFVQRSGVTGNDPLQLPMLAIAP